jgi:predicted nucleic-acid-binding Zn-ribbon protein
MVMPLGNVKFVCEKCGWSKSVHLKSDVIFGKPDKCPKCGEEEFKLKKVKMLTSGLFGLFK